MYKTVLKKNESSLQQQFKTIYGTTVTTMGQPWDNSASELFANLNIQLFGEKLRCFVYGFRSRIMISGNLMLIGI